MIASGADPELAGTLSDVYSWTIDFFGIQPKDSFAVYYEEIFADSVRVGTGNVLAANFITGNKNHFAFYYTYREDRGEYFDENGQSLRRAFLKAPLKYSRISSHFSNARRHPITKVVRPHHGVDYAAPSGTPVHSVGDGTVIGKGWDSKGGGNFVRIKHNGTYTTLYMHLKGFADGIYQGARVTQGQRISSSISDTLIPLAYNEMTSFSMERPRLSCLGTTIGSNSPLRSRGMDMTDSPCSV